MTLDDRTEPVAEIEELGAIDDETPARRRPSPTYDPNAIVLCENLVKIYKVADLEVVALQGLDLVVGTGEFIALVGASGSGKSTLLNILGGLDVPSAGRAVVAGHDLTDMDAGGQTRYRRRTIGFVWQQTARNLLPYLTALENVMLPMVVDGAAGAARERFARSLLARVGLADRADHKPEQLSGGEQQRVAIAVALANRPPVLLADEPTGELDTTTAHEVFDLLRRLNRELGVTIVVVTHDPLVSEQVDRTVAIRDGRVSSEVLRERSVSASGDHHVTATEFAVLDRVGRLQLPRSQVEALGLARRVRVELVDDHLEIWPDGRTPTSTSTPTPTPTPTPATEPVTPPTPTALVAPVPPVAPVSPVPPPLSPSAPTAPARPSAPPARPPDRPQGRPR